MACQTMIELEATAISTGTPSSKTIAATFKMPPPTPTMPLTKPANMETGTAMKRFIQYCSLLMVRRQEVSLPRQIGSPRLLSILNISGKAAVVIAPARSRRRTSSFIRLEKIPPIKALVVVTLSSTSASSQSILPLFAKVMEEENDSTIIKKRLVVAAWCTLVPSQTCTGVYKTPPPCPTMDETSEATKMQTIKRMNIILMPSAPSGRIQRVCVL
jgi:hypothetical protein